MAQSHKTVGRRSFLAGSAGLALAAGATTTAARASQSSNPETGFKFAVEKTPEEWKAQLGDDAFHILREGGTEFPTSSDYWAESKPGIYHCKGCDQALYTSEDYSLQEIGFVFFRHSLPFSIVLNKHTTDYNGAFPEPRDYIESVCSRCGGHLGHVLLVNKEVLHCINGTVLDLKPAEA
ncbi:peptide-methionine (R)-S-oxide reductase [Litoreibacter roseus]|uniref:peptide-methionine (R)-S-oxide reductase n=1 Tax=Litoreibacter roseus TaxID=2601869 RepID=A0A6N6JH27_9RHOB|nr:peptide-methionine (R)-S-oxide reductase [Litoreibacter roseus]GFE65424.1 peptide-methionine (R)-S-oxide reductase [Litoreibacter roseus]